MQYRLDKLNMPYAMQDELFLVCKNWSENTMNLMEDLIDYDDINYPWFPRTILPSDMIIPMKYFLPKQDFLIHRNQHDDWYNLEQYLQVFLVQHVLSPIENEDVISIP